tara:strand:+ start:28364 stop:28843 length:480 start_codon:yes stop_codon:yes gene_type:complete
MSDDKTYYTYALDKPLLGKYLGKTVAIRPSWVRRCQRYAGATGLNIRTVFKFINNGLIDRSTEGFNDEGLDGKLSDAQKWVLLYLFLGRGVPEFIQNPDVDEKLPSLVNEEPIESTGIVGTVSSTAAAAANVVTTPVKSLADMVTGKKEKNVEETEDGE